MSQSNILFHKEYGTKPKKQRIVETTQIQHEPTSSLHAQIEDLRERLENLPYDEYKNITFSLPDGSKLELTRVSKKSKLPLILSVIGLSALMTTALLGLPQPYGIIMSIAIGGPLYVSLYGLKKHVRR